MDDSKVKGKEIFLEIFIRNYLIIYPTAPNDQTEAFALKKIYTQV